MQSDFDAAENLITRELDNSADYERYAIRAFIRSCRSQWDAALEDAQKVRKFLHLCQ